MTVSASRPDSRRKEAAAALARDILTVLDRRARAGRPPDVDSGPLTEAVLLALGEDPQVGPALQMWLAGEDDHRGPVEHALTKKLVADPGLMAEFRAVLDELARREAERSEYRREAERSEYRRRKDGDGRVEGARPADDLDAVARRAGRAAGDLRDWVQERAGAFSTDRLKAARARLPKRKRQSVTRLVSTGVARSDGSVLGPQWTLAVDTTYRYWFSIGRAPEEGRVDLGPHQRLPRHPDLRPGVRLRVVLFAFDDELVIDPAHDVGVLELDDTGGARVVAPVLPDDRAVHRLAFPVRTAPRPGVQRLRCNVYDDTRLLQSRVLSATVAAVESRTGGDVTTSATDYSVARNLDAAGTGQAPRLSLFANDGSAGKSNFRFYGENDLNTSRGTQVSTRTSSARCSTPFARRCGRPRGTPRWSGPTRTPTGTSIPWRRRCWKRTSSRWRAADGSSGTRSPTSWGGD